MGTLCVKFHDYRCKGKAVMHQETFSVIDASWHWSLDPEINRAHPWLFESLYVQFHSWMCKGKAVLCVKSFSEINAMHYDLHLLTPKSIGLILDSLEVWVWIFMIKNAKENSFAPKHISSIINHKCTVSLTCDLLTWNE